MLQNAFQPRFNVGRCRPSKNGTLPSVSKLFGADRILRAIPKTNRGLTRWRTQGRQNRYIRFDNLLVRRPWRVAIDGSGLGAGLAAPNRRKFARLKSDTLSGPAQGSDTALEFSPALNRRLIRAVGQSGAGSPDADQFVNARRREQVSRMRDRHARGVTAMGSQ